MAMVTPGMLRALACLPRCALPRLRTPRTLLPAHPRAFLSSTAVRSPTGIPTPARTSTRLNHTTTTTTTTTTPNSPPASHLTVSLDGHPAAIFDAAFLRDACACPACRDPHSRQKLFATSDIPAELRASYQHVDNGAAIEVRWEGDLEGWGSEHVSRFSLAYLQRTLRTQSKLDAGERADDRVLWDRDTITRDNMWVDYRAYMDSDESLFDALTHLHRYGLLFIRGVPESEESVVDLASRIGTLKDTFYGRTWDVRSKARAENIAYTPQFLGLHMDLLYTTNPPHLQLLHSLRARTPGGASFFSDALAVAGKLQVEEPEAYEILTRFPVTYHYHHETYHYHFTRPVLELHPGTDASTPASTALRRINWSPPFQSPFESHTADIRPFIAASHAYESRLSAEENLFEYRLNEGECVIFDNRRTLHARRAFDATKGERWLKGAYVDDDVFFSRLRVLQERFTGEWVAEGVERKRV